MLNPFMVMKWREHYNNNHRTTGPLSPIDWSWLDKPKPLSSGSTPQGEFERLWESQWSIGFEGVLRNTCLFNDEDIRLTHSRMLMGGLRYAPLASGDFAKFSRDYYLMRIEKCVLASHTNLEACYDYANLVRLASEAGHLCAEETGTMLAMLSMIRKVCRDENIPYIAEDRKDF